MGRVRVYQAIKPNGEALWEEQRPLAWLEREKGMMTTAYFNAQYMNDPSGMFGVRYDLRFLNYYTIEQRPPLDSLIGVQGADPATSESTSANYFGHCTAGKDPSTGIIYVLGFAFANIAATKHEAFLRTQYYAWEAQGLSVHNVRQESHGPIQAATQFLMDSNRQNHVNPLPLEIVKPKGSKEERFDELIPHMGNGTILFPGQRGVEGIELASNTGLDEFKKEWASFPLSGRDDLLDALWIAVDGLLGTSPAASVVRKTPPDEENPSLLPEEDYPATSPSIIPDAKMPLMRTRRQSVRSGGIMTSLWDSRRRKAGLADF